MSTLILLSRFYSHWTRESNSQLCLFLLVRVYSHWPGEPNSLTFDYPPVQALQPLDRRLEFTLAFFSWTGSTAIVQGNRITIIILLFQAYKDAYVEAYVRPKQAHKDACKRVNSRRRG